MNRLSVILLAVCMALTVLPASAHEYTTGSLTIEHPWSRAMPPGVKMGVGYMVIVNHGDKNIILTGASSARAGAVSLHRSRMKDGLMHMEPMPNGIMIPAGQTVALKPQSYHVMLEQLAAPLKKGERVPLALTFDGAPAVTVELAVDNGEGQSDASGMMMNNDDRNVMPMDHDHMGHQQ